MQWPVLLVPELDGQITAILEGDSRSATAPTREEALARLRFRAERVLRGEVERAMLELPDAPNDWITELAGVFADDPDLPGIVAAAYAARDRDLDGGS